MKKSLWVSGSAGKNPEFSGWHVCYIGELRTVLTYNVHNKFWASLSGKTYKPEEITWWLNDKDIPFEVSETESLPPKIGRISDDLLCCEIKINDWNTVIYMTYYVKMEKDPHERHADFKYLRMEGGKDNAYMYGDKKFPGEDLSFEQFLSERTKTLKPHTCKTMIFKELPEDVKTMFRKFESFAKLNLDVVKWQPGISKYNFLVTQ